MAGQSIRRKDQWFLIEITTSPGLLMTFKSENYGDL